MPEKVVCVLIFPGQLSLFSVDVLKVMSLFSISTLKVMSLLNVGTPKVASF